MDLCEVQMLRPVAERAASQVVSSSKASDVLYYA